MEKLADLKARLVLKRKDLHEGFGRVSISKPKSKIYKSNLKRIDDKFNFPIVLGRGVYKTFILKIGHIISGDQFRKDPFFYPVDFKSRRRYYKFDCDDEKFEKGEKIYYQCCIKTNEQNIPVVSFPH